MEKIRFGLRMREGLSLDLCRRAEELGYDALWMGEHMLFHIPTFDALIVLATYAARTEKIKLATGVLSLSLRHPISIAKAAGTLDVLSKGRLILGIGVGGDYPPEFEALGIPLKERGPRADEAIALLRRLWSESGVTHDGPFFPLKEATMEPKPVQPGGPPIWMAGSSDGALRRAARLGDGIIPYPETPEFYREARRKITAWAQEAGRDISSFTWGVFPMVQIADSYEEARQRAAYYLKVIYPDWPDSMVDRCCIMGTLKDCIRQLEEMVKAGARYFVLAPLCTNREFPEHMDLYAREIVHYFQRV